MVLDTYDSFYEELKNALPEFAFMASMMTMTTEPSKIPTKEPAETERMTEPTKFQEAWDHVDPLQRQKWRGAIKELCDMINCGVFRQVNVPAMRQEQMGFQDQKEWCFRC